MVQFIRGDKILGHLDKMHRNSKWYGKDMRVREIDEIIEEYTLIAKTVKQPDWPVKRAAIYFMYDNKSYIIYPEHIGASEEVFEVLSDDMINDLYRVGARYMFYSGMLD